MQNSILFLHSLQNEFVHLKIQTCQVKHVTNQGSLLVNMSYEPMMSQALYGVRLGYHLPLFSNGYGRDIFPVIILPHQKITQKSEET